MAGPITDTHQHLRAWRKIAGMTLEQVGNAIGSKVNTISGWETGARTVDLDDLKRLADTYGVHPAALLFAPPGGPEFDRLKSVDALLKEMDEEAARLWFDIGHKLATGNK